jgi:hypothetical protein
MNRYEEMQREEAKTHRITANKKKYTNRSGKDIIVPLDSDVSKMVSIKKRCKCYITRKQKKFLKYLSKLEDQYQYAKVDWIIKRDDDMCSIQKDSINTIDEIVNCVKSIKYDVPDTIVNILYPEIYKNIYADSKSKQETFVGDVEKTDSDGKERIYRIHACIKYYMNSKSLNKMFRPQRYPHDTVYVIKIKEHGFTVVTRSNEDLEYILDDLNEPEETSTECKVDTTFDYVKEYVDY